MSGRWGWAADSAAAIVNARPATAAAVNPSSHPLIRRTWRDQVGRARTGGVSDLAEDFAGGGWGMLLRRAGGGPRHVAPAGWGSRIIKSPCPGLPGQAASCAQHRRREARHTGPAVLQV